MLFGPIMIDGVTIWTVVLEIAGAKPPLEFHHPMTKFRGSPANRRSGRAQHKLSRVLRDWESTAVRIALHAP